MIQLNKTIRLYLRVIELNSKKNIVPVYFVHRYASLSHDEENRKFSVRIKTQVAGFKAFL